MNLFGRISFYFAWYDLWVGFYWDRIKRRLYFLPLPCCVIQINFPGEDEALDIRTVIKSYLDKNGFDGLVGDECACHLTDLMPCDNPLDCHPGYSTVCGGCDEFADCLTICPGRGCWANPPLDGSQEDASA